MSLSKTEVFEVPKAPLRAPGKGGWERPRPASADAGEPKRARERTSTDLGYQKVTPNVIFERPTSEPLPEHTRKLLDSNFSLGSAEVGAALWNFQAGNRAGKMCCAVAIQQYWPGPPRQRTVCRFSMASCPKVSPLRHASNPCGPFNLCSLLSAVSLGPPEGATTHHLPVAHFRPPSILHFV